MPTLYRNWTCHQLLLSRRNLYVWPNCRFEIPVGAEHLWPMTSGQRLSRTERLPNTSTTKSPRCARPALQSGNIPRVAQTSQAHSRENRSRNSSCMKCNDLQPVVQQAIPSQVQTWRVQEISFGCIVGEEGRAAH